MPETTVPSALPRVDVRAARLSQALVAGLVGLALLLRAPALLALAGIHLALAATLGRRGNLAIRFFDAVLRPRLGPPAWEDARPPRFASLVGATVIVLALAALTSGAAALGWALGAIVGVLAFVAATTGACVGCWLYGYLGPFRGLVRWIG
jgi:hypothetical protein